MPEDSSGPTYRTLISHTINLQSIASKNIQLELRANRKDRSLQLYLDGNELEQGLDPSDPPLGTHVLFESLSTTRSSTLISKIIVQEWHQGTTKFTNSPRPQRVKKTRQTTDRKTNGTTLPTPPSHRRPTHPLPNPTRRNNPQSLPPITRPASD